MPACVPEPEAGPRGGGVMDGQHAVIDFLGRPESHGIRDVQRFETHGNLVFLAGQDAYKIKRAVHFDYMDFSTLEKRRLACQREVEINRRWAPDLYLGCVPIKRRSDGTLSFTGEGETVEWAVHMRRFEQDDLLSTYAARSPIDRQLATQLAYTVHVSHEKAERIAGASGIASYRKLSGSICHGLAMAKVFEPADIERLGAGLERQLDRAAAIIDERAAHGHVRRCHGDLHLANIVLQNGKPTLYDAIEFDETLATIDTLYDLAFLLMDLDFQGQRPAGNVVLNRYLWRSGEERDLRGLAAMPLFLTLRAAVRARVTADRAAQKASPARDRDRALARRYLAAALRHATPSPPRLVVVGGLSGTGKTTLAAALAPDLGAVPGAVHLRSDLERKALAGVGEFDRLPAMSYAPQARQNVYASLHRKVAIALEAQHSVIVDAVYDNESDRSEIGKLAQSFDIPLRGLWLHAELAALVARVKARRDDASDATPDVVRRQLAAGMVHLSRHWTTLDAGKSPTDTAHAAMAAIGGSA